MLIFITCTYKRPNRFTLIKNLSNIIGQISDILWIVVEDNDSIDLDIKTILPKNSIYLYTGPSKDKGHAQRNLALEYIRHNKLSGIIYNFDDDNKYDPKLFEELKKTKRIAFFPVGNLGPFGVERPIIENGKFKDWEANWKSRKFCVDMAGFAFHSDLLKNLDSPMWNFKGMGGESEFLEKIVKDINDVEFLCDNCTKVYVWHNGNV